ncbi:MAG: HAD-IA family hydrolase [Chloroflexi bacterium]|nr:HAD-IA family hydrolase [Chloroflexota bacterium]
MGSLFGRSVDLLCLDLDDTLIDGEAAAPRRFHDAVEVVRRLRPNLAPADLEVIVDRALATDPNRGRMASFIDDLELTAEHEVQQVRAAYFATMPEGTTLFEGAHDILRALRARFPLAIVTNGPSELQRRKIEFFDLERYVDWIVVSGEVGIEKPAPQIFHHTLGLAAVNASRAAHVGDSRHADVAGANRAGLMSVWVETRFAHNPDGDRDLIPDRTIAHIRDLLDA